MNAPGRKGPTCQAGRDLRQVTTASSPNWDGSLVGGSKSHLPPAETSLEPQVWIDVAADDLGVVPDPVQAPSSQAREIELLVLVSGACQKVAL